MSVELVKGRIRGFKVIILCCREHRLFCLYRFKMWWMVPRIGNAARDIPIETQMLLLEATPNSTIHALSDISPFYILLLPVIDGAFRSSLQGNSVNELEVCVESGNFCPSYLFTHV